MAALGPRVAVHGLAVRHPRRGRGRVDSVLALQLLERDVEVDVAEAGDHELLGLLAALHVQGWVFLAEPGKTARDLLLVTVRLGRDGQAVGGARNLDRRQRASVLHAEGVAGERVRQLGCGCDVAGVDLGCR